MTASASGLPFVAEEHPAERSYLLRYRAFLGTAPGLPELRAEDLAAASAGREGLSFRSLCERRGVRIDALDLSSHAYTGTVKTGSAAFLTAAFLRLGLRAVAILSSGNKATSLRAFALRRGISVVSIVPRESEAKLREVPERVPGARDVIVLVDAPNDEALKTWGRSLAAELGIPCQPVVEHYACVDRLRAAAYLERLSQGGEAYTHFIQPVSSNYGLYGTYLGLEELRARGLLRAPLPVPVAVQQDAIAPLVDIFERGLPEEEAFRRAEAGYARAFERTLFTTRPATVPQNRWLRQRFGARFTTLSWDELRRGYGAAREALQAGGVRLPESLDALEEKTGAMAVAAALRDAGGPDLPAGSRALIHFTGGVTALPPFSGRHATVLRCRPDRAGAAAAQLRLALRG